MPTIPVPNRAAMIDLPPVGSKVEHHQVKGRCPHAMHKLAQSRASDFADPVRQATRTRQVWEYGRPHWALRKVSQREIERMGLNKVEMEPDSEFPYHDPFFGCGFRMHRPDPLDRVLQHAYVDSSADQSTALTNLARRVELRHENEVMEHKMHADREQHRV